MLTYDEYRAAHPKHTIDQMQRLGVEPNGVPLKDEGVVGPKTRSGLFLNPDGQHELVETMIWLSLHNARESGGNNCGYWPAILMGMNNYVATDDQRKWHGVPQGLWCAGTVSWAIWQTYGPGQPKSWGARELGRLWARRPGTVIKDLDDAQPGDVIVWRREAADGNKAAGHVGVIGDKTDSLLLVMEGNGGRTEGAVGLYGYSLANEAKRGRRNPMEVLMIARRPRVG
jgi:hypothetical protein